MILCDVRLKKKTETKFTYTHGRSQVCQCEIYLFEGMTVRLRLQ